jgi:hypothetical protein
VLWYGELGGNHVIAVSAPFPGAKMLHKVQVMGALSIASSVSADAMAAAFEERGREPRKPTPYNDLGRFLQKTSAEFHELASRRRSWLALGRFRTTFRHAWPGSCGAVLEIWQTDHYGHYDIEGYRCRTTLSADSQGRYRLESVMPGHYPDRACQHIHYLVTAPGCKPQS